MEKESSGPSEADRVFVEAMRLAGEPLAVVQDVLTCLDLSDCERDGLTELAASITPFSGASAPRSTADATGA